MKPNRMTVQLTEELKTFFDTAARSKGMTTNGFIVATLYDVMNTARRAMRDYETGDHGTYNEWARKWGYDLEKEIIEEGAKK